MKTIKLTESELKEVITKIVMEQLPNQQPQSSPVKTGNPVKFQPGLKGTLEVDCKNKMVKNTVINNGLQQLSKEGNSLLVQLFCEPKYRNTSRVQTSTQKTVTNTTLPAVNVTAPRL